MTSDLAELLARVEAAEGADRQIDHELSIALTQFGFHGEFTASLDATLALCERVLPDHTWDIGCADVGHGERRYSAIVWTADATGDSGECISASKALALLAALLKAKIAQTEPTP